jgi:electron transport complex protein RnfA
MEIAKNLMIILLTGILTENFVLSKFLGICPFLGVSKKLDSSIGMGAAVTFVMVCASLVTYPIYYGILVPLGIEYMNTIAFILVIAVFVQLVEMVLKKYMPPLYKSLGVYLPLITTNCAVLGVALNSVTKGYNILESVVYGFATAFGFFIAIVLMAGVREKIEYNDIPKPFQGTAIVLLTACLMAIAFMGFSGMVSV